MANVALVSIYRNYQDKFLVTVPPNMSARNLGMATDIIRLLVA